MLSIPEPCHEDFSKMTPTQRGSFCGKCQIDTFDFRNLSDLEVNRVLLENKNEHLCGQFTNTQLVSLNNGFLEWKNQKSNTFRSKFLLALILVFGLGLFSCTNEAEKTIVQIQAIALTQDTDRRGFINGVVEEQELDLLDYVAEDKEETEATQEVCAMPGMVAFDVVEFEEAPPVLTTAGVMEMPLPQRGGAMVATSYLTYLEDTINVESLDETFVEEENEWHAQAAFTATAYPNPTQINSTLALEVKTAGQFDIGLFDLSGRLVTAVYRGVIEKGRRNFTVNLDEQPAGMYLIKITSNNQQESVKVQKVN